MKNKVISTLGEITHVEPIVLSGMLAYTVNISPKHTIKGFIGQWGKMEPDEQLKILKTIHKRIFIEINKYIDEKNENGSNKVWFEFTKSGELHSHGYFCLKSHYAGYDRYKVMVQKKVQSMLPRSNYCVCVKWADDPSKWIEYCSKEEFRSGYKPYEAEFCETVVKDILWFIEKKDI